MNTVVSLVKPKGRSLLSVASSSNRLCSGNSVISDKENNLSNCARIHNKSRSRESPRNLEDDRTGLFKIIKPERVRVNRSNPTGHVNNINNKSDTKSMNGPRINEMNIQMLSEGLYHQIFGREEKQSPPDPKLIESARAFLKEHGLWTDEVNVLEDVSLDLPPLVGKNIEEHFMSIGKEQAEPYKKLLVSFANNGIPSPPKKWLCQKGWTKYVDGEKPKSVPFPDEDALVFDVEVCIKLGELPTLATAVSPTAWYGWVCSDLADGIDSVPPNCYKTDMLIPLEGETLSKEKPRIVIGHNVSYDRARVKEQYYIKNSALRFLDTMSLHTCIGGTNRQIKVGKSKSNQEEMDLWQPQFCLSSLKDIYLLYCNKELNKEVRNVFMEGDLSEIRKDFQVLMNYCADDVKATFEVFQTIFNTFLNRFPHPVTLAGMLEMGTAFLPVNYNWTKFVAESEHTYNDLKHEISFLLSKKSDNACRLLHNEEYKNDLWMWSEDWSTQKLNLIKGRRGKKKENEISTETKAETSNEDEDITEVELSKKFQYLFDLEEQLPLNKPFLPGYPLWYRKLLERPSSENWTPHPQLTTGLTITPKLLKLTWEDFPLHHIHELGWGILVADIFCATVCTSMPFEKIKELTLKNCKINSTVLEALNFDRNKKKSKSLKNIFHVPYYKGHGILSGEMIDECCYFFKLPHKYGRGNVGSPLSNDFNQTINNSLKGSDSVAGKVLDMRKKLTYWRNNRERISGQMVVWLNKNDSYDEEISSGVIIPKVVVCGTVTRRAMENTWLTASKVTENRIGSELRSMVQAPPGYHIVGADVDSQELWIASLIGDSNYAKVHGCTPIGWMTLSGTKANGSDMHSVTAKTIGISRNHAKILNYARIYGAGVHFAQRLVQEFNPTMTVEEAKAKARKMYDLTKGKKVFKLKESHSEEFRNAFGSEAEVYDIFTATRVAKYMGRKLDELFEKSHWVNGTESDMFNELEKIANSYKPVTPFLRCRLSSSLEPKFAGDDFYMSTRVNWVVQSGAVDFLHLMLVCMRWLTNGRARYCFSFHDEVRYLIPSGERYNAALAMHITNLLVRAFCAHRLGIKDLPQSVAFFSAVDVDTTLRKEANDDCITPSNPHGIEKGYGIPPGESLSIYETIKKCNGSLAPFKNTGIKPEMSQATKRKHVHREVLQGELVPPEGTQQIVRVVGSRGNNLHEVETPESTTFLVSMPTKFRKNVWIKKGDYILIEPIEEGEKVKGEMVKVLTPDYIKFLKKENIWPNEFTENREQQSEDDNDLCINNNRNAVLNETESEDETD